MTGPISGRNTPLILVVDDEEDILELVKYNLKKEGFDVHCAENGLEAIAQAKESIPDVIVMDIMMPKMDGIEASRKLREHAKLRSIPILMLTARSDESDQVQGLDAEGFQPSRDRFEVVDDESPVVDPATRRRIAIRLLVQGKKPDGGRAHDHVGAVVCAAVLGDLEAEQAVIEIDGRCQVRNCQVQVVDGADSDHGDPPLCACGQARVSDIHCAAPGTEFGAGGRQAMDAGR